MNKTRAENGALKLEKDCLAASIYPKGNVIEGRILYLANMKILI